MEEFPKEACRKEELPKAARPRVVHQQEVCLRVECLKEVFQREVCLMGAKEAR